MYKDYDYYNPSVKVKYDKKHDYWILLRGPETFYNEICELRTWDTREEAIEWLRVNHPEYKVVD